MKWSLMPLLLLAVTAVAQPPAEKTKVFDTQTKFELSFAGAASAADAWTTRLNNESKYGAYEINPITRPFVKSTSGTVAYFGAGYGALIGSNVLLRNHPKWKHTLNWVWIGSETGWAIHNARQRRY